MMKNELPEEISSDAQKPIKILIAGLARNCRNTLVPSIRQLQTLFGPDVSLSFFLVESDSTDGTQQLLEKLAREIPRFNHQALGNLVPEIPNRILRIANCRNQYLRYLRDQLTSGNRIEYLVVADFDGVNSRISPPQTIEQLFSRDTIVSSNQKGRYYDILALRASSWVEEDYRTSISKDPNNRNRLNRLTGYLNFVSSKQRLISKNDPPIKVESAFGGLAIYPTHLLDDCKYEPKELSPGVWECEHVGFNAQALKNGGQMIILPSLRNKAPLAHTFFSFLLPGLVFKALIALEEKSFKNK
jgi:hypothetical protein